MNPTLVDNIWRRRRHQTGTLAKATKKRELPEITLTPEEWNLLQEGAELEHKARLVAEQDR